MSSSGWPRWRIAAVLAALAGYAWLSHALMVGAPSHALTLALLFGPLLVALAIAGARQRHLPTLAGCAALTLLLATVLAGGAEGDAERLYVLQHAGLHLAFGVSFAVTLRQPGGALITRLAERVHGPRFTAPMRAYTRRLTAAWVVYFFGMTALSVALYVSAPWSWWSLFCNLVSPLAAAAFFVGELFYRRWRHPGFERASMAQALAAYWRVPQAGE